MPASVDPRRIQVFAEGNELAIRLQGEQDGRLDASDRVELYGTGVDTPCTDTRVHWLTGGASAGKRIPLGQGTWSAASGKSFAYTVEKRDRTVYFAAMLNADAEYFFGSVVTGVRSCPGACDVNRDGAVNVLDFQVLLNVVLGLRACP